MAFLGGILVFTLLALLFACFFVGFSIIALLFEISPILGIIALIVLLVYAVKQDLK